MSATQQSKAEALIVKIRDLKPELERLAGAFRSDGTSKTFDIFSEDAWRRNVYGNALIRLRQFTENNFNYIETMGLLATTRYVFELSVWLRLFKKNPRYCLVYYRELLKTQLMFNRDALTHLRLEINLLKQLDAKDAAATDAVLKTVIQQPSATNFGELTRAAMAAVDAEASRTFAIYADEAKHNGYGYQAHLVETQAVPKFEEIIAALEADLQVFQNTVSGAVKALSSRKWQWRQMATEADIAHEHDYIYCYASKLLHATPASLTTNQKNLEMDEVCIFLRYIYVKMLEIADLAHGQPESKPRPA